MSHQYIELILFVFVISCHFIIAFRSKCHVFRLVDFDHGFAVFRSNQMSTQWDTLIDGAYVIISVFLWSVNEAVIKKTGIQLSGVLFISNVVSAVCCLLYWYILDPMPGLKLFGDSNRERWTLFFFFLAQSTIFSFYYALIRLPLGDLACIGYQAPLWIVLCSWLFFNETLPPWYIYLPAALCVVAGVLFVAQPSFLFFGGSNSTSLPIDGVIASFISAARWVVMVMIVKKGGNTLHSVQYQFVSNIACLAISVPILLTLNSVLFHDEGIGTFDSFLYISWIHLLVALYVGITYFIGFFLNTIAYQRGNVAMIGWLEYFAIPLAFIYQICIFHDEPGDIEGAGASMVMVGCLLPGVHQIAMIWMGKEETVVLTENNLRHIMYEEINSVGSGSVHSSFLSDLGSIEV